MTTKKTSTPKRGLTSRTLLLLLLPVILLAGVIFLFLRTGGGLDLAAPAPIEDIAIERVVLPEPGVIELHLRNAGPEPVTVAQVMVNDAIRLFTIEPGATIPRLGRAVIHMEYGWVEGEAYEVVLFTSNAVTFAAEIPVAFVTPQPDSATFLGFTLIGLYVGVLPVFLGILWFPALRELGKGWMTFLMAATNGLLIFLGIDTLVEALEQAERVPGPFQGVGLVGIGAVATFFLLDAISQRQRQIGRSESEQRLAVAFMIATGIGLHNLGEGLAIGAAYGVGEIALGTFLVVGFIIQNITEGLGIIAPVLRDRPTLRNLILMGVIGGAPAIVGAWVGGFLPSATMAALFLAIGTGAIFEVVYEIAKMIRKDTEKTPMPTTVFWGTLAGLMLLWVTGLLIK